jgi:hypothetical protein
MVDPTSLSLALSALEDYTQRDDVMKVVSSEVMNKGVNNSIESDVLVGTTIAVRLMIGNDAADEIYHHFIEILNGV